MDSGLQVFSHFCPQFFEVEVGTQSLDAIWSQIRIITVTLL